MSQKKARADSGTFMAEGLKLVIDALDLGWTIRTLIYAKSAKGKPLVDKVAARALTRAPRARGQREGPGGGDAA